MKFVKVMHHNKREILINLDSVQAIEFVVAGQTRVHFNTEFSMTLRESFETMEKLVGLGQDEKPEPLSRRGPTP